MLHKDFSEFITLLIKHQVEYLVVGGFAVGAYGHPRYTGDLDIWINRNPGNAKRIKHSLNEFGFNIADVEISDFLQKAKVIQLGYPPLRIDLLTDIEGVHFDEAYKNKKVFELDGMLVDFISIQDLIINKRASGRPIDLDDIEKLSGNQG
jgi:hypothetical protein